MKKLVAILSVLFIGTALTAQEKVDSTETSTKKDTSYTIEWGKKTIIIMDKENWRMPTLIEIQDIFNNQDFDQMVGRSRNATCRGLWNRWMITDYCSLVR